VGTETKIAKVNGGIDLVKRLSEMGFTAGTKVKIIHGEDLHGSVLVEVRDSRVMLGNDVATKIIVEEVK